MYDTTVVYPKFLDFCVKVYRWGDKTFNSYDTAYVKGTGKNWKAIINNNNWTDSYALNIGDKMPIRIMSDIHVNVGAHLHFMAVSVGYMVDLSNVIGNKPLNRKKVEVSFSTARFTVEGHYAENTGGSYIRKFGDYRGGDFIKVAMPGINMKTYGAQGYYFFNNRKYSQGAVYNFSKYQVKSAGSFIVGFHYNNLDINLDMNQLPERLLPYLTIAPERYKFHYKNYSVMGGYGYNLVFAKNFTFNITALPAIGLGSTYADDYEGHKKMLVLNIFGKTGISWNINDIFLGITARIDGYWYNNKNLSLFNSIETLNANVGVRF